LQVDTVHGTGVTNEEQNDTTTIIANSNICTPKNSTATNMVDHRSSIYVVFDIETAGLSKESNANIQIAADVLDHEGDHMVDSKYNSLLNHHIEFLSLLHS
jgi:DNA polymerase III alpha subunit (gram-positive type)